ncbi:MAG: hypothetical protein KC425_11985 [Anaerolineales bacterium]|nr:hypothetical protein [Anaerolineales bacterium]
MNFQTWLNLQKDREDRIGRLARKFADIDLSKHIYSRRRKQDEHLKWATILTRYGNQSHIRSFNQAWEEFQAAEQVRTE